MSNQNIKSGSQSDTEFITIGEILGAWGLKGAIRVRPTTDFPSRFDQGAQVFLNGLPSIIEYSSWQKGNVIIKIPEISSPEEASKHRGSFLEIPKEALRTLPKDQYYQFDIIGLRVYTLRDEFLGTVQQILNCGNDVYVVKNPGSKDQLIPATREIIKSIDLAQKKMLIDPIDGLLE